MVELGEAGRELAGTRARRGDDDQRAGGFDVVIFAVALVADDERDIVRVTFDDVVEVDADAVFFKMVLEEQGAVLAFKMRDDDGSDEEAALAEFVHEAENVGVVGDAEVAPDLVVLNVHRGDDDDDLRLVAQLGEHAQLGIRLEAGKHAGCVVIVKELAAEFEVELAAEFRNAGFDAFGLHFEIFFIAETDFHGDLLAVNGPLKQYHTTELQSGKIFIHKIFTHFCK